MKKNNVFALVALTAALVFGSAASTGTQGYQPGDKAADFSLLSTDSSMVGFGNYDSAKGFIVIFTCNHCPFSIAYEDRIIELHNKYAPKGYPVIAINPNDASQYPDDSFEKMKERAKSKGFPFAYLYDETQQTAKAYGAERTPHVYIVQKQGKENVVKFVGAIDNNHQDATKADKKYAENALDALLAGKTPELGFVKAVGCGIKWKK